MSINLVSFSEDVINSIHSLPNIQTLITQFKAEFEKDFHWNATCTELAKQITASIEQEIKTRCLASFNAVYGETSYTPSDEEYESYFSYLNALSRLGKVKIKVIGYTHSLLSVPWQRLITTPTFSIVPNDLDQRLAYQSALGAQILLYVKPDSLTLLAKALSQLFNDNNRTWLQQAVIANVTGDHSRIGCARIVLNQTGTQYADMIRQILEQDTTLKDAFIDYTPLGTHRISTGLAYVETFTENATVSDVTNTNPNQDLLLHQSNSYQTAIAAAITNTLLTEESITDSLNQQLYQQGYTLDNPGFISPTWHLAFTYSYGMRPSQYAMSAWTKSPEQFAATHVITTSSLNYDDDDAFKINVELVEAGSNTYQIIRAPDEDSNTISAYLLGYHGDDPTNPAPAYIDIPKAATTTKFLFTASLHGASIIVTELNADTWRVHHDARLNSSTLYDNVVMAIDADDYANTSIDQSIGTAYMHYYDNQWHLILQRQRWSFDQQNYSLALVKDYALSIKQPLLNNSTNTVRRSQRGIETKTQENQAILLEAQQKLCLTRPQLQQVLRALAEQCGITQENIQTLAQDQAYQDNSSINNQHPSIRNWQKLRNLIKIKFSRIANDKPFQTDHESILYFIDKSEQADILWLWQQKKALGRTVVEYRRAPSLTNSSRSSSEERDPDTLSMQLRLSNKDFAHGYDNFTAINIPGYRQNLSLDEKKALRNAALNDEQKGALTRRIQIAMQIANLKVVRHSVKQTEEIFRQNKCVYQKMMSQAHYLSAMGEKKGRCYPLVRAMAVAISRSKTAVDNLNAKLFSATHRPLAANSILLRDALRSLHVNPDASAATHSIGRPLNTDFSSSEKSPISKSKSAHYVTLGGIVQDLAMTKLNLGESHLVALNTERHSLLLGVSYRQETSPFKQNGQVSQARTYFYFYDPNTGLAVFDDTESLFNAAHELLITNKLADYYQAYSGMLPNNQEPEFLAEVIDTKKMAEVTLTVDGGCVTVRDLVRADPLVDTFKQGYLFRQTLAVAHNLSNSRKLEMVLTVDKACQQADAFHQAMSDIRQSANIDASWVPALAYMRELPDNTYEIPFIQANNTDNPILKIKTNDARPKQFKTYLDNHLNNLRNSYELKSGHFQPLPELSHARAVDGMNSGFAIQQLIYLFSQKTRDETTNSQINSSALNTAITLHGYLNTAQLAHGNINDLTHLTNLVHILQQGEAAAMENALLTFNQSFEHINTAAGIVFGGAAVVLDAYERVSATDPVQKAILSTQLIFDSASFGTNILGFSLSMIGATTASAIVSSAGVIIGGLTIGITALARTLGDIVDHAIQVGNYFSEVDRAYQQNGYQYDEAKKILLPLAGAVIKKIDFQNSSVELGSQYIYRTRRREDEEEHNSWVGFVPWPGWKPKMVRDKNKALEIRSGIGYGQVKVPLAQANSSALILPATPISYIAHYHDVCLFATTRQDNGFDIARRLESTQRFDYSFYCFPAEYIVTNLSHEYQATSVEVQLDNAMRYLYVPDLAKEVQNYLTYTLLGVGGRYVITLNEGASIRLVSNKQKSASHWILDTHALDKKNWKLNANYLMIGNVLISFDLDSSDTLIISQASEMYQIDVARQQAMLIHIDARSWSSLNPTGNQANDLNLHLKSLATNKQLAAYVVVDHYTFEGNQVGRAFYDAANTRMLWSNTNCLGLTTDAELFATNSIYTYFYHSTQAMVWRVKTATGDIDTVFNTFFDRKNAPIIKIWQGTNDDLFFIRQHSLGSGGVGELHYRIQGERIELIQVTGGAALQAEIDKIETHAVLLTLLHDYDGSTATNLTAFTLPAKTVQAQISKTVTIHCQDSQGSIYRYWIRDDGKLIKPNWGSLPTHITASSNCPSDLTFIGSAIASYGIEAYFFYSASQKLIYRQEESFLVNSRSTQLTVINIDNLMDFIFVNEHFFAITTDGLIKRVDAAGQIHLEGVNSTWLAQHPEWRTDLFALVTPSHPALAVFGIKASNESPNSTDLLPTWYVHGTWVIAAPMLKNRPLRLISLSEKKKHAYLFDNDTGQFYAQGLLSEATLAQAFGSHIALTQPELIPASVELFTNVRFLAPLTSSNGHMRLVSVDGNHVVQFNQHDQPFLIKTAFGKPQRINDTLFIHGSNHQDSGLLPCIANINTLALAGYGNSDTYQIDINVWNHYDMIVIDNFDNATAPDTLLLSVNNLNTLTVARTPQDLLLVDANGTTLVFKSVYGTQAQAYRHLQLKSNDTKSWLDISIDNVIDTFDKRYPQSKSTTLISQAAFLVDLLADSASSTAPSQPTQEPSAVWPQTLITTPMS